MKKLCIKLIALLLLMCLFAPIASAENSWVESFRETIRKSYNPSTCGYYGLFDIGSDGTPKLLINERKGSKVMINVYYITKKGKVRKVSKYAGPNIPTSDYIASTFVFENDSLVLLYGISKDDKYSTLRTIEISQKASKIVQVKEMFRLDTPSSENSKYKKRYFYKGKRCSEAKFTKLNEQYSENMLNCISSSFDYPQTFSSVNDVIEQFESDAAAFHDASAD